MEWGKTTWFSVDPHRGNQDYPEIHPRGRVDVCAYDPRGKKHFHVNDFATPDNPLGTWGGK